MNHSLIAMAFQVDPADDSSMWIILAVVLVILFFIVVIVVVGLVIFFVMRKRKAKQVSAMTAGPSTYEPLPAVESAPVLPAFDAAPSEASSPVPSAPMSSLEGAVSDSEVFDPTRTVAISRDETAALTFGSIKFVSGVLAGESFDVNPMGAYVGRESTMADIVVSDPRISKRHLWIGVRGGAVTIEDQNSRNGTFVNDPKSERVNQATLKSGDTVILGESDVARFEYHS
ncbi:MAG TPA: FHA domain-containing protein [Pyrinomonadaceae bacterium]|nr:FHA domain-containing protein [Pyrinomonadaceae bacterium]